MTDQERNQVLKMIEEGKITPEQGLHLMQALDQQVPPKNIPPSPLRPLPPGNEAQQGEAQPARPDLTPDPRVERLKANRPPSLADPALGRHRYHRPERIGNVRASCTAPA